MQNYLVILVTVLLSTPMASAIGRTGNWVVDDVDGFAAMVPPDYNAEQPMGNGNLRLLNPAAPMNFPFGPPAMVELLRVEGVYPEFQSMTRADIGSALVADGWQKQTSFDSCVDLFSKRTVGTALALAVWGQYRGVLIRAPNSDDNWQAANVILTSVKIRPGACDWK